MLCLPESELRTIITEEVETAVKLAVREAVAEERSLRIAAEARAEDAEAGRRSARIFAGGSLAVSAVLFLIALFT